MGIIKGIIYRLIYISGVWMLFRYFNRRKLAIVMYHGVCRGEMYLWTQLPAAKFEAQLKYINRHYRTIPLAYALEMLKGNRPALAYPLVITFDDGFLNNKTIACECLKKYKMPAEIFLTTSFVDGNTAHCGLIWTDYLLEMFRHSPKSQVDLRDLGLGMIQLGDPRQRIMAGYRICRALKRVDLSKETGLIGLIAERLETDLSKVDLDPLRGLTWHDIARMYQEESITFGAHTINHNILSNLSYETILEEVRGSQQIIEGHLNAPVRHFAYPNGTAADFNKLAKSAVSQYFDCSLSTIEGLNTSKTDRYELRRIGVGNDMPLWKFKLELAGVSYILHKMSDGLFRSKGVADKAGDGAASKKNVMIARRNDID